MGAPDQAVWPERKPDHSRYVVGNRRKRDVPAYVIITVCGGAAVRAGCVCVCVCVCAVGIQNPEEQRLARAVSEADGRAVAREIGALYCAEVSLSHRAAIESLFERVGCAALGLYDPFAPLRDPALRAKAEARAWHVPSSELCSQLLAQAKAKAQQSRATSSSSTGATCVLQ